MKFLFSILFSLIISTSLFAQDYATVAVDGNNEYQNQMLSQIDKLKVIQKQEEFDEMANSFGRISEVANDQWLPKYYAAYCIIMGTLVGNDKNTVDEKITVANKYLDEATAISPDNSEILCLQSLAYTAGIGVDPQNRGMKYSVNANQLVQTAKKLDPSNPRPYYLEAQSLFYTPEMFGGGKKLAKAKFQDALKYFSAFKPQSDLHPNWGVDICKQLLMDCDK